MHSPITIGYRVLGTGNRSEIEVGYFTKYGDGGADLLPLGSLTKTLVRRLAEHLDVPCRVIDKPPSAGLWSGQTDEGEMGLTYAELDAYLTTGEAPAEVKAKFAGPMQRAPHSAHSARSPPRSAPAWPCPQAPREATRPPRPALAAGGTTRPLPVNSRPLISGGRPQ